MNEQKQKSFESLEDIIKNQELQVKYLEENIATATANHNKALQALNKLKELAKSEEFSAKFKVFLSLVK